MQNTIDKSVQRNVMALLGWDEQKYAQYIHDCGVKYLEKYIPEYRVVINQIIRSEIFWNWWKAHWEKRELQFIESIDYEESPLLDAEEIYMEYHDPRTLAIALYLNGQVLQESYAQMIGELTDTQVTKTKREGVVA